ncbi:MAG TPA: septal ring lytic transglycosylase RlpA family protein [Stellaceae bacterium]|nr:septal ring lytic transglycosylase RlpA family protein [Stellaceae bacterium]
MPMRQSIGLSLALLMISTAALAGTPKKNGSEPLIQPPGNSLRGAARAAKSRKARGSRQMIGRAAWYGLEGRRTASGERMDDRRVTAAHRWLPLLSYARVTNLDNGRSVVVEINDRGPMSHRFIIDLSPRAAKELGMLRRGVAEVEVQPVAFDAGEPRRIAAAE